MLLRSTLFRSRLSKGAHVATGSTAAPHLGCCFEAHRRCFSGNSPAQQQRKQKSRAAHPRPAARRSDTFEQLNELQRLREAIATIDTAQVLKNYSHLRGKTPFGPQDALDIARCLHNDVRQSTRTVSDDSLQQISTLLQMLTVDIKGGYLPPSPPAISTLLGIYRHFGLNDQAADFWSWLIRQGNEFLDQSVYAQAVDLKVDEGRPLFDIEAIFQDYLKRFPGNYLEYHLSPNAVPSQPSASLASEVPVQLLSSVTRARLQRNRTKDAYLMLDTMLRLVPEKQLNMGNFAEIVRERPLLEAFTTFHLACRYPKYTRNDLLNDVLDKMRPVGQWEPHLCLIIARATIRLLYVVLASSHSLSSGNTAKALLNVFRLVHLPGFITSPRSTKDEIADLLFVAVKTILAVLNKHGVKQNISAINHLLNAFGKQACHADATAFVLRMQAEGHVAGERTGVTSAILLQTAGNMGDRAMLRQAWSQLCEQKADALTPGDWILFAEAALKCEYLRLFDAEANRMGMDDRKTEILSHANSKMDRAAVATALAEPQSGHEMLEAAKFIHDDAISLKGLLEGWPGRIAVPASDLPPQLAVGKMGSAESCVAMREFYSSLVSMDSQVEPSSDDTGSQKDPHYRDWLTISELLASAEDCDNAVQQQQKSSIERGEQRSREFIWNGIAKHQLRSQKSFGLSDLWPVERQQKQPMSILMERRPTVDVDTVKKVRNLSSR